MEMATIPKSERRAAIDALNNVRQWLGAADYREIALELGNVKAETVRQVAKGERFNLEVYTKLLKLGRAKAAAFAYTLDGSARNAAKQGRTTTEPTSTAKTPEIAPNEQAIPFPDKPLPKKRITAKPKADPADTTANGGNAGLTAATAAAEPHAERPSRRKAAAAAKATA